MENPYAHDPQFADSDWITGTYADADDPPTAVWPDEHPFCVSPCDDAAEIAREAEAERSAARLASGAHAKEQRAEYERELAAYLDDLRADLLARF